MEQYGRTPVCLDQFLDWNKYRGRVMTEDERVESLVKDIKNASKLGCTVIRVIHDVSPRIMERAAPYAEEYNVRLGNEIHAPSHLDDDFSKSLFEMMQRTGSKYVGFVIDMGIYTRRMPRVVSDRWIRDGMREDIAQYIIDAYNRHEGLDSLPDDVKKMGGTAPEVDMARTGTHNIYVDPRRMLDFMPWIFHIHAKFNEMLPDYTEYSIAYDEVIPVLIEGGYDGYLSSEYEGNRHIQDAFEVESVGQVRRHQVMLKRQMTVTLDGRTYKLSELENEAEDRWEFGDVGILTVRKPGGLAPGEHQVDLSQHMKISYIMSFGGEGFTGRDTKRLSLAACARKSEQRRMTRRRAPRR